MGKPKKPTEHDGRGAAAGSGGSGGKKTPSVTEFLSRISSGKGAQALGLLADVTPEELRAAGRGEGGSEIVPLLEGSARIDAELSQPPTRAGAGDGAETPAKTRRGQGEGRSASRVQAGAPVEVCGFFPTRADRIANASLGGVFVETAQPLEIGDPLVLSFTFGGRKMRVSGRVRWVTPFGRLEDARAGMGVELVGGTPADRQALFEMLTRGT
jgi:hypothetical protein